MTKQLIGFVLDGHDNGTYMFDSSEYAVPRCPTCGYLIPISMTNSGYSFTKTSRPYETDFEVSPQAALTATYDGQSVAFKSLKDFCLENHYSGIEFFPFKDDIEHFHFKVTSEIKIDIIQSNVRFSKLCPVCGNYESVLGEQVFHLVYPLPDGFYRSDLFFGNGDDKTPLYIVGIETKIKLEAAKLVGIEFTPAYGSSQLL